MPATPMHKLKTTTPNPLNPGRAFYHCTCGAFYADNERDFNDHVKLWSSGTYGITPVPELPEPVQYEPARDEYVLNTDEIAIIKQGLELFIGLFTQTRPGDARDAARLLEEL